MAIEIERKFLVDVDKLANCSYANCPTAVSFIIRQGYLLDVGNHTLRIRTTSLGKSLLTYKGPSKGISRTEIEIPVYPIIGKFLLGICDSILTKTRTVFPTIERAHGKASTKWEVDVFHNLPTPLVVAEIELPSEDTEFSKPDWLLEEVSLNPYYYNSNLIKEAL